MEMSADKIIKLPQGEECFVVTKGISGVLYIFRENNWEEFDKWLFKMCSLTSRRAREFNRFFKGSAIECEVEADGNWSIPDVFLMYLGLGKEINTVELYNVEQYINLRKEELSELEKKVLEYVDFVIGVLEE